MTKQQGTLFDGLGPVMPAKLTTHPLYGVWVTMKARCGNPKSPPFKHYGGRGIVVCEEWAASSRSFIAWALVKGWQPGLELDRRDNDGPYSPGNCRFVTRSVNLLNRRDTVRLSDGRAALPQAQRNGVSRSAFYSRLRLGWTPEQAAGIAPAPHLRVCVRLSDGRAAWPQAERNGVSRSAYDGRLRRGWTPEQAAGIAPAPQRRQNSLGRAAPWRPVAMETVYEKQAATASAGGVIPDNAKVAENARVRDALLAVDAGAAADNEGGTA